ncbi:MAG TPA: DNA polymerase/3'-5' exonuclease PolX [Phototrophicaceae bacterium]|nr:DNA polymerase/3'-5' exonuclease PolX [Phototrophicaceae bacterium]
MTNREIADIFDNIADMLEIKGEIIHRVMAYRNAAGAIRDLSRDVNALAAEGELGTIPFVGKIISEKIQEMLDTGKLNFYEELKAEVPEGVVNILHINGVGPKKAKQFWENGITSVDALEAAAKEGKLNGLPGMGAKTQAKILEGIESLKRRAADTRTPLGTALPAAESLLQRLLDLPQAIKGTVGGSIRRGRPTIGDVDLLVASTDPTPIMDAFVHMPEVARILGNGEKKSSVELHTGLQVDLRVLPPERYGTALQYFTGSQAHNIHIREIALAQGLSLNEHAFTPVDKKGEPTGAPEILCATEEEVYKTIGLPWIPPEIREDRGEIEAAQKHKLPTLITLEDMRADLHMHTVWSDGKFTVREMAEAALARGRQYICITDHSKGATIANGLTVERLLEQHEEIVKADADLRPFRVFHGTEMEIRADGELDFPDEVLEKLDFVIASLHQGLRQPRAQVTARILNAINNPHVDLIGHPRGQLIMERDGADLDMDAVFAAAQKSGIALEINANPHRLDLEAQYAQRAVELGIPLCIDTDAHAIDQMDLLRFGIITARRGWVEAKSVINTWPLDQFLEWVQKRGHHA